MLNAQRALIIILLLLIGSGAFAGSQPPPPRPVNKSSPQYVTDNNTKNTTQDQHYTNSQAPTAKSKVIDKSEPKQTSKQNENKASMKTPDERIATYTFWLMIVAGIQAIIFIAQLIAMVIQAKRLRETVEATKVAANAAQKGAEVIPLIERAYVFVSIRDHPDDMIPTGPESYEVNISLNNCGKTPAILKQWNSRIAKVEVGEYPKRHTGELDDLPIGIIISSNDMYFVHKSFTATPQEWSEINDSNIMLVCYGWVKYNDIFGQKHETGFCWEYIPHGHEKRFSISDNTDLNYYD
jgi:hypothetical protein